MCRSFGCDRGSSAVEFALVAPLLLLFLSGLVDAGRAIWTYVGVQSAVQEASTYAAYAPNDDAGIAARAVTGVDWPTLTSGDISVWCPDAGGENVSVSVRYDLALITPVVSQWLGGTIRLEKTVVARTVSSVRCDDG